MIILINGAFGVGKTTVAEKLTSKLENSMIFDPEEVGYMLRNIVTDDIKLLHEKTDDFQDIQLWKSLTVHIAGLLKNTYGKDLIIPMTIHNKSYFHYILAGLTDIDESTYHFCLTADRETIHDRLRSRGETEGNWCFQQTEKCLTSYQDPCFQAFIQTEDLSLDEITEIIKKAVG
ncbi:AAA family ATPase [Bacillus sp. Marseille-Q3570]|uniref:AAA family ATPase n=1 Tax=Bacillus sp. Marseille-Q3570 TaxID=2963522 RepID=UPI0021B81919|nr:AAA family ATPase [Bacillus sp. Marseille-Q3570]